jgi:hypothetical protein
VGAAKVEIHKQILAVMVFVVVDLGLLGDLVEVLDRMELTDKVDGLAEGVTELQHIHMQHLDQVELLVKLLL